MAWRLRNTPASLLRGHALNSLSFNFSLPSSFPTRSSQLSCSAVPRLPHTNFSPHLSMSTFHLDSETALKYLERNWDNPNVSLDRKNIVDLPDGAILKTGGEHCRIDYAWLKAFEGCTLPNNVCVPRLLSELTTFRFEGASQYGFAMKKFDFQTLEEYAKDKPMDDNLADQIVQSFISLRTVISTKVTSEVVPGLDQCLLQGHMFPADADSPWRVSSRSDVRKILNDITGDCHNFEGSWEWALGDLSPGNIFPILENHQVVGICFLDFGYSMALPSGYDLWTLENSHYDRDFTVPLLKAFTRKGFVIDPGRAAAFSRVRTVCREG